MALLAMVRVRESNREQAAAMAKEAIDVNPDCGEALSLLAALCWFSGDVPGAARFTKELVRLNPRDAHAVNNLGLCYSNGGQHDLAAECFERACSIEPQIAIFHQNFANSLHLINRPAEAIRQFRLATQLDPSSFDSLTSLAAQLILAGELREAVECYNRAAALKPETAPGLISAAKAHIYGDSDIRSAESYLRKAILADPANPGAHGVLGYVLQKTGCLDEAANCLKAAIELEPENPEHYADLVSGMKVDTGDLSIVHQMTTLLLKPGRSANDRRVLSYGLGKASSDLGRVGDAMRYYDEAHGIEIREFGKKFDRIKYSESVDATIELFSRLRTTIRDMPSSPTRRPIFIVGMMRSGTSLVEQILSNHPEVSGAGEMDFWVRRADEAIDSDRGSLNASRCAVLVQDYLRLIEAVDGNAKHITDKLPDNYRFLGLLSLLFPNTSIIHCHRNPIDNCLSIYMQSFLYAPNYVHDKADLAFAYTRYRRLMEHWHEVLPSGRIHDLNYDELVMDPEPVIRRLLTHCGLDWNHACLHPESNRRPVLTASHWQVRQPMYSSSVGRWRKYEPWLGALGNLQET